MFSRQVFSSSSSNPVDQDEGDDDLVAAKKAALSFVVIGMLSIFEHALTIESNE